jgi:hypothetical protein
VLLLLLASLTVAAQPLPTAATSSDCRFVLKSVFLCFFLLP